MATQLFKPQQTAFYSRFPENYLLVENHEDGRSRHPVRPSIIIPSDARSFIIRELASEGFIPDEYQFMTNTTGDGFFGVPWVIEGSWLVGSLRKSLQTAFAEVGKSFSACLPLPRSSLIG